MKVNLIKPSENKIYDISDAYESVSWSGSALSAGRNVEIAYINAPTDTNIVIPQISTGDFLALEENGKEFFMVSLWEQSGQANWERSRIQLRIS